MNIINIYENNYYFNADYKAIFEICSKIAQKNSYKIYLIGGLVRDILLSTNANADKIASVDNTYQSRYSMPRNDADIDISVEGDAIEFAKVLEQEVNAKILSVHKKFGTAKVEIQEKKIDFASTRSETYPKKGHLPHAEIGCSLEKDVLRRDFTVNSLAVSLNQDSFADLIDYVGGLEDLRSKKIRVLHKKSFIDDPTRIIRGLKYSTRLGFELEEETLELQNNYLKNINYDMGKKRIKQEIKKTFNDCGEGTFDKFIEQGIYKLITKTKIKKPKINFENLIRKYKPKHPWLVHFGTIVINENLEKFELTKSEKNIILDAKNLIKSTFSDDFDIYKAFCGKKTETLLILAIQGKEKQVLHYLDNLQKIKLRINGDDLIKLGFKPSKSFGEGLDYVLGEKLKNPNLKKSEELELFKKFYTQWAV
ncbi:MAG: hypothetical protein WCY19_02460 [Candidatus Gastranaerophilaceae bacterium]